MDEVRFPRNYHSSMHYLSEFTSFGPTRFTYKMYRDYPQESPFIKKHFNNGWIDAGDPYTSNSRYGIISEIEASRQFQSEY